MSGLVLNRVHAKPVPLIENWKVENQISQLFGIITHALLDIHNSALTPQVIGDQL